MATICKIEKMVRATNVVSGSVPGRLYSKILVWAVLDDEGHTVYETSSADDSDFTLCRKWLEKNPQPLVACITCQE